MHEKRISELGSDRHVPHMGRIRKAYKIFVYKLECNVTA